MKYGYFDNENREYVIDRIDLPTSWTNYLGVEETCAVINHTAGGYVFHRSPEYHRITRFRANGVPNDRPGHYVYIRDNENADYFSVSWQPVGKPLAEAGIDEPGRAKYLCRHGMSYTVYECEYDGITASQRMTVPLGEAVLLWDVKIKNNSNRPRDLSVFNYCEFSFHNIPIDNQNFQMSLYCAGSAYDEENGIIEYDLFYEPDGYQYMAANFTPDGFDCLRDKFLGLYRTEDNPIAVENGKCHSSHELTGNHCGTLQKNILLAPGEEVRLIFMLGEGDRREGRRVKAKYSDVNAVDAAYQALGDYWQKKFACLQITTPNAGMNTLLNTWTLYQAEINVMFSRFASFIEVGGRTGLGFRDTAQDAMTIPHSNPTKCRERIVQLLNGLVSKGYGIHLFQPEWFAPREEKKETFKSPTVIPMMDSSSYVHGLEDACSDDALWLVVAIVEYIRETGELDFADLVVPYADGGEGSVYEHITSILDFSAEQVGATGICKGLRADWNDCLNLGGGESAMVSFLHHWALGHFLHLARFLGRTEDVTKYEAMRKKVRAVCERELWDGDWYIRGFTASGRKIGTDGEKEGKIHLESNAWAVLSEAAPYEKGIKAMDSIDKHLFTRYGLMLNAPSYRKPDDELGFIGRVYPGVKENGAVFSHPNPWAWAAECILGRGDRAMKFYDALCPYHQNDMIEIREAEPYSYCQFIMGVEHTAHGRARHPFMTGTGGWAYFSATRYMLGIRPDFDRLTIDPCVPADWRDFSVTRRFRGADYHISIENPDGVMKGVRKVYLNGEEVAYIPVMAAGSVNEVKIVMGE
ncbi:MAG: N,N'-diacetylchitobiose phosphorylase [Lachnospiraceae bacterium]|jgi:N,N'-diacetylchitobiose phosphorylase|nr:N,N'-diacetylchitobiose phosphorylase [Lachnospiraceae bacterium]